MGGNNIGQVGGYWRRPGPRSGGCAGTRLSNHQIVQVAGRQGVASFFDPGWLRKTPPEPPFSTAVPYVVPTAPEFFTQNAFVHVRASFQR